MHWSPLSGRFRANYRENGNRSIANVSRQDTARSMDTTAAPHYKEYAIEEFFVRSEPYYRPVGDELELFTGAYNQRIPVLLTGPTGCGKTRFVEYMAWKLGRPLTVVREQGQSQSRADAVR